MSFWHHSYILIPCLIAGAISVTGLIIGRYKVKIGGIILLTPIPIALLIGTVLIPPSSFSWMGMILSEIVFPIGILVVIGAIVLIASKKP